MRNCHENGKLPVLQPDSDIYYLEKFIKVGKSMDLEKLSIGVESVVLKKVLVALGSLKPSVGQASLVVA